MLLQQEAQGEMKERMREQQERGRVAAEEARRAATVPKPMLQTFSEKDKVESYLLNKSSRRKFGLHSSSGSSQAMPWNATCLPLPKIMTRSEH